jgi:hypothetical protein
MPPMAAPSTGTPSARASMMLKGLFSYHSDGTTRNRAAASAARTFSQL